MCIVFHQIFYADPIIQFTAKLDELNSGGMGELFHQFTQWNAVLNTRQIGAVAQNIMTATFDFWTL